MSVLELTSEPPQGKKAVLLFWADWHEASVEGGTMGVVLSALAASNSANSDTVIFGRVQAEAVQSLTEKYGVTAVPTFVLLDAAGNVVARIEGDSQDQVPTVTKAVQNLIQSSQTDGLPAAASALVVSPEERLTQRLDQLIRSSNVMVFIKGEPGAPKCGFSRQIMELLEEENIPYGSFDSLSDDTVRQGLKTHSDWPTYPQLYVNGELVGGLDIVKEMKQEGSLREQLGIGDDIMVAKPAETLEQRLAKLVRRHKVMLFMKGLPSAPKCGFSRQMVEILDSKNISYDTFNILEDEEVRQGLKKFSDWPTYPQLYANGELLGGLDIVKELVESGELEDMIQG